MGQKYKVFLEDKVIIFTDIELAGIQEVRISKATDYESMLREIELENQLISQNPQKSMMDFFIDYKFIEAAGGVVRSGKEFLFINRFGFWDIPKGKMEKNEVPEITAIREIQEECGLTGDLKIQKKLIDTYHTYIFKNKSVLKKTHWYLLDYTGNKTTVPQLEEGITEVSWIEEEDFSKIKACTYSSILSVLSTLSEE
jgi:8-oxo-dGTP pyrophosphatase MutT (NUDIX family)